MSATVIVRGKIYTVISRHHDLEDANDALVKRLRADPDEGSRVVPHKDAAGRLVGFKLIFPA